MTDTSKGIDPQFDKACVAARDAINANLTLDEEGYASAAEVTVVVGLLITHLLFSARDLGASPIALGEVSGHLMKAINHGLHGEIQFPSVGDDDTAH